MASSSSQPIRGAYYSREAKNNGAAHHGPVNIDPDAIELRYFTHIFYAFINPDGSSLEYEISKDDGSKFIDFTKTLHHNNPLVKILFSVGSGFFRSIVSSQESQRKFIRSSIKVAREYGFDGVDLDWEFPNNEKEMANFGSLLEEWRVVEREDAKINGRQEPLLLTAAVYYRNTIPWKTNNPAYPARSMNRNLDFINVMTFDYYEYDPKDPFTGAHTALFDPENIQNNVCTSAGLESWREAGVNRSKLIMGLPLFGRTWKLADPAQNGIRAPAVGPGEGDTAVGPGKGVTVVGVLTYANVVRYNNVNAADVVHHEDTKSVYSVSESEKHWMSYDDPWSVREKINHARTQRYGGYFFWQVGGDDNWDLSRTALESWP